MAFTPNDRSIVGLTMTGHALVHTYELSIPIFMTLWTSEFAASPAELGVVVSIGYALFGLGSLPSGLLTDRYGSTRMITGCLAGMGVSFLVLSFAQNLIAVGAALVLWGISASVYHPSGLSLISRGAVRRGKAFGYHGVAGNAGIALGPLATTILLLFFGWRTVAALLGIPALIAILYASQVDVNETAAVSSEDSQIETTGISYQKFLDDSRTLFASLFTAVFILALLSGLYYRGILTFLPELLSNFSTFDPIQLGGKTLEPGRYIYAALLTIGMFGQYVGGRITDRYSVERSLIISFFILAAIALLFIPAAGQGLFPLLTISAALGFFLFVVQPLYQALVAEYSPAQTRGLSYGYAYLAVFGIGALGAALTGILLEYSTPTTMFASLAALSATAAFLSVYIGRRKTKRTS